MEKFRNGKCSKILNTFLFLFSTKMLVITAEIHKTLVIIANRGDANSNLGLQCLSRHFCQATSVRNFRTFTVSQFTSLNNFKKRVSYPKSQALSTVSSFKHHYFAQKENTANYMGCNLRKPVFQVIPKPASSATETS